MSAIKLHNPNKPKTTEEFIVEMLNHSQYGAIVQGFIIEAISNYADAVAEADPATLETPFISGAAWVGCAKEVKAKIAAQYSERVL